MTADNLIVLLQRVRLMDTFSTLVKGEGGRCYRKRRFEGRKKTQVVVCTVPYESDASLAGCLT